MGVPFLHILYIVILITPVSSFSWSAMSKYRPSFLEIRLNTRPEVLPLVTTTVPPESYPSL